MIRAGLVFGVTLILAFAPACAEECRRSVPDASNRMVCIPDQIERIVITCYGGAVQEIALFKGDDKIVAQPDVRRFPQFTRMYSRLSKLPSIGSFNDVNLESLLAMRPDIVFSSYFSASTNDRIRALGIPVFDLGTGRQNIQTILKEFEHVGILLDEENKARELIAYWHEQLDTIRTRTVDIKTPKKTLYLGSSGGTENRLGWGDAFITAAGGINVAHDAETGGIVSVEQIHLWNPDVIVTSTSKDKRTPAASFREKPAYRQIRAITDGQVHTTPVGGFWWDRPSPEAILGIVWLSKILYPELMQDVDLEKETKSFFARFYNYTLSDTEYRSFFQQEIY